MITFRRTPTADRSYCGVAGDWEYFARACDRDTSEPVVIAYQGFEFASVAFKGTQQFLAPVPCNYFAPLNDTKGRRVPWRELLLALDTPAAMKDFDWQHPHDLVAEECALSPVCAIPLPRTLGDYLASLSKDDRYEFRRTNRQCAKLRVRFELPSLWQVGRMMDIFAEHQLKKYDWYYTVEQVESMRLANILFVARAEALGTLFPMSVYDGDELVALNIAEKVGGRIIDTTPLYDHDRYHHLPLGIFMINQNIEAAIAQGCTLYDLGILDDSLSDEKRISDVYSYKSKWMPRGVEVPQVYGCAVMHATQQPVPPYFDFTTKELRAM